MSKFQEAKDKAMQEMLAGLNEMSEQKPKYRSKDNGATTILSQAMFEAVHLNPDYKYFIAQFLGHAIQYVVEMRAKEQREEFFSHYKENQ